MRSNTHGRVRRLGHRSLVLGRWLRWWWEYLAERADWLGQAGGLVHYGAQSLYVLHALQRLLPLCYDSHQPDMFTSTNSESCMASRYSESYMTCPPVDIVSHACHTVSMDGSHNM